MAKKRTKSQKRKAATRRPSQVNVGYAPDHAGKSGSSYSVTSKKADVPSTPQTSAASQKPAARVEKKRDPLVRTDPQLIKKDMGKALAVSILLLSLLLGIYVLTRYNVVNLPFFS